MRSGCLTAKSQAPSTCSLQDENFVTNEEKHEFRERAGELLFAAGIMVVGDQGIPTVAIDVNELRVKLVARMMGFDVSASPSIFQTAGAFVDVWNIVVDVAERDLTSWRQQIG